MIDTSIQASSECGSDDVSVALGFLTPKLSSRIRKSRIAPLLLVSELNNVMKASPLKTAATPTHGDNVGGDDLSVLAGDSPMGIVCVTILVQK